MVIMKFIIFINFPQKIVGNSVDYGGNCGKLRDVHSVFLWETIRNGIFILYLFGLEKPDSIFSHDLY